MGALSSLLKSVLRRVEKAEPRAVSAPTDLHHAASGFRPPRGSTPTAHPDLGVNNPHRVGTTSWVDGNGVTHTPVNGLDLYKGARPDAADHYRANGHSQPGGGNAGHSDPDWQGSYFYDDRDMADAYANQADDRTGRPLGGSLFGYRHGPTTVLTPGHEITDAGPGKAVLGMGADRPLVDQLGPDQVLRNPVHQGTSDATHEYIVPWDAPAGPMREVGSYDRRGTWTDA